MSEHWEHYAVCNLEKSDGREMTGNALFEQQREREMD
jgi:hypothetical protein